MNENLLSLLKLDLGITHDLRDAYFSNILTAAQNELSSMGAQIDLSLVEDQMLIVDYAVWTYRKRQENIPLSRNIQFRINNRIIRKAGVSNA